jgi:hypothetical protein
MKIDVNMFRYIYRIQIHLWTCFLVFPSLIRCQCQENWFGRNCSDINICNYNGTSLCPNGFICKITDENQECKLLHISRCQLFRFRTIDFIYCLVYSDRNLGLAMATFEGNRSSLIATLNHSSMTNISNELSLRLRARSQRAHLLTIKNMYTSHYISLYLYDQHLIYRDSILTSDLLIDLPNTIFDNWTRLHFYWSEFSTVTINHLFTYTISLSLKSLLTLNGQTQIFIGNGFHGCLDDVVIGENIYVPFYYEHDIRFTHRRNRFSIEQFEHIQINNCTFDGICNETICEHGHCVKDFDQGKCLCQLGWTGEHCQTDINECEQENNCSKNKSICEDHPHGFYTCRCHAGFTGQL